ncbi:MAG: 2-hydroxyacyl-CoA dehydratase family protein [Thermodesulfobacteriota bacterium]|nr:2-hydroxyacyl-CoA dehydratase family protein [Thermodesulfobacteriota bacterium]
MAEEQAKKKHKKRRTATKAAASIGPMVKEFIAGTIRAKEEAKQKVAFTFIVCHHEEILSALDVVPLWTENFAGICGAIRQADRFLERAESLGFSRSLCTYALCGLGFDQWREELGEMPPDAPWGGQARPDFMVSTGQILCDPRAKWYQASQQFMPDVPIYNIDMPYPLFDPNKDHRDVWGYYHKYIVKEMRGFIKFVEEQTGNKMDYDRLSELVDLSDRTWNLIDETYKLRAATPCPMGTGDAMNTMVPMCFKMASQEAYDFFLGLNAELKEKIAKKEGIAEEEKYRLIWGGGLPSWFALGDFNYFNSKGAVFPVETTYRMVAPLDEMDLPETNDPVERLAWKWLGYWTFWYDKARKRPGSEPDVERIIEWIEEYNIDGIVMHEAFSCRTWHIGLIWQLHQIAKIYKPIPVLMLGGDGKKKEAGRELPSLILESDIIDISSYSEVDTRNRIDAFIETLESVEKTRIR